MAAVDASLLKIRYAGNPSRSARAIQHLLDYGRLYFKAPQDAEARMRQAIGEDAVLVSESFAILSLKEKRRRYIELTTPAGQRRFQIAAIYYDYRATGARRYDRATYARLLASVLQAGPSTLSIYLRPARMKTR